MPSTVNVTLVAQKVNDDERKHSCIQLLLWVPWLGVAAAYVRHLEWQHNWNIPLTEKRLDDLIIINDELVNDIIVKFTMFFLQFPSNKDNSRTESCWDVPSLTHNNSWVKFR